MSFLMRWSNEIAAANDDVTRRRLLGEIGLFRARHLTDVPAQREAAGALARLYNLLGERDQAEKEARGLISLCQTPPVASKDELHAATQLLATLGGKKAVVGPTGGERRERAERPERRERDREERPKRERAAKPTSDRPDALALAYDGRFDAAREALDGARGPRARMIRLYVELAHALALRDDATRVGRIREIVDHLGALLSGPDRGGEEPGSEAPKAAARPAAPATPEEAALSKLLDAPVPRGWRGRIAAIEAALDAHPDRADAIAAAALRHHVAVDGERSPAPWLATVVASALLGGGKATRATIDDLASRGAFAVTLYGEPAFEALVGAARSLAKGGHGLIALRRGVMSRGEPTDHKLWTLRVAWPDGDRLLALAPAGGGAALAPLADAIAERVVALGPASALCAPGLEYEALRAAAAARSVAVSEDLGAEALAAALIALPASSPPRKREEAAPEPSSDPLDALVGGAAQAPREPKEPRERKKRDSDAHQQRDAALGALLASGVAEDAALDAALGAYPRAWISLKVAREALDARTDADALAAAVAVLRSVDRVAPAEVRAPEGTTWAVELVARGADPSVLTGTRFGGPASHAIVGIARALHGAGFAIDRAHRGASKKEREADPVLAAIDGDVGGLWRLRAGTTEVAFLSDLTPEGKATALRLLTSDAPRVVAVDVSGGLPGWWRESGGKDAIGWTGDEGADLVAAVKAIAG
jgi:hypothetical protein